MSETVVAERLQPVEGWHGIELCEASCRKAFRVAQSPDQSPDEVILFRAR